MTEADYELECMRAELLGIDKPCREDFFSNRHDNLPQTTVDEENLEPETTEVVQEQGESINRAAGGLDEITNILSVTQKKINHLKTLCGSFSGILKLKSYSGKSEGEENKSPPLDVSSTDASSLSIKNKNAEENDSQMLGIQQSIQGDIESAVGTQISKLDSIILKADKANLSLSSQNKQMRQILKK